MDIKKKVLFFFTGKRRWKFALFAAVFFAFFFVLAGKNSANAYYDSVRKTFNFEESVFGSKEFNQESYTFSSLENTIQSLNTMIGGCATQECQKKLGANGGAIGTVASLITTLYANPPASSAYYLADLGARLNLIQPAYAQGIGYSGLRPLLPLWKASRNIAYTIIVLVLLFIGFGIMLRVKISPQATITAQQAIPKIITTLILITFSYAIAGLIIDLMYLLIGLGLGIIPSSFKSSLPHGDNVSYYYGGGAGELFHNVWDAAWGSVGRIASGFIGQTALVEGAGIGIGVITGLLISTSGIAALLGGLAGAALLLFVILVIILFNYIKILFTLLSSYVNIIISIIIAPIQIMFSAIPGQNTFGAWLRNIFKNILVFPATIMMLVLAFIVSDLSRFSEQGEIWAPPLLGLWGNQTGKAMGGILGLGIVLLIPKVADIIKSMFEKKPFPYGSAIREALEEGKPLRGAAASLAGFGVGTGLEKLSTSTKTSKTIKGIASQGLRFLETKGYKRQG